MCPYRLVLQFRVVRLSPRISDSSLFTFLNGQLTGGVPKIRVPQSEIFQRISGHIRLKRELLHQVFNRRAWRPGAGLHLPLGRFKQGFGAIPVLQCIQQRRAGEVRQA